MRTLPKVALGASSLLLALSGYVVAQESNPVTSNPPPSAVGRKSETSPGTPNKQNGTPNEKATAPAAPPATGVGSRGINGAPPNAGGVTPVPNLKSLDQQGRGGHQN